MALTLDHPFTGAADTDLSASSATIGAVDNITHFGSGRLVLNGAGQLRANNNDTFSQFRTGTGDTTTTEIFDVTFPATLAAGSFGDFYAVALADGSQGLALSVFSSGVVQMRTFTTGYAVLATSTRTFTGGQTVRFTVVKNGDTFSVYVDNETTADTELSLTNTTFTGQTGQYCYYERTGSAELLIDRIRRSDSLDVPTGGGATNGSASGVVVFTGAATGAFPPPPLASPPQVRSRRLRGHPLRTLTLRGNGVAPAGGSGSATGAAVFTGAAAGALRVQGSATGAARFVGAATGALKNEGDASGAAVLRSAATGALRNEGDATGVVVFGGAATGAQGTVNSGNATGAALFTGSAAGQLRLAGAAAGTALFTGSAAGALRVQGAATGAMRLTGVATGRLAVQGAGSGVAVFTGAAAGSQAAPGAGGSAAGVAVFAGAASGALRLAGAASGVVVFRGNAGGVDPDPGGGGSSGRMRRRRVQTPYQFVQ